MPRKFPPTVTVTLTDDTVAALHALADQGAHTWEGVAHIADAIVSDCHAEGVRPKMGDLWASIGAEVGRPANTVKQWTLVYQKCETFIGVYTEFGFDHWRCLLALAQKQDRELEDVVQEWFVSADNHNGRPVPVDVLRAALTGDPAPTAAGTPLDRALSALDRDTARLDKLLNVDTYPRELEEWVDVRSAVITFILECRLLYGGGKATQ